MIFAILPSLCCLKAQDFSDGTALIPLTIAPLEQDGVPAAVQNAMKDKLMQVVVKNGLGSSDTYSRFAITASLTESFKDFVAGPPAQVSAGYDVTFYIVDNFDHKVFATGTVSTKSVDYSPQKAMIRAIRGVNASNAQLKAFVQSGRAKIVDYYNTQCDNLIAKARSLAAINQYDAAFYELASIPEACSEAYRKALTAGNEIYKAWADYNGKKLLDAAKAIWAAGQNRESAQKAGYLLSQIESEASCRPQAEKLYNEIKGRIREYWDFDMKVYNDSVSIEKQKIDAWKAVGVAYGNHQPEKSYDISWVVR